MHPGHAGARLGLVSSQATGASDDKLLRMYPGLKRKDLKAAWDFVEANLPAIERMIQENEAW
jgi:uncharacterized protein (DUF433 family)